MMCGHIALYMSMFVHIMDIHHALAQYNMFVYVYLSHLHNSEAMARPKDTPGDDFKPNFMAWSN